MSVVEVLNAPMQGKQLLYFGLFVFFCLWITCLTMVIRRLGQRRTLLYIDVCAKEYCIQIYYLTLPDADRCHVLDMTSTQTILKLKSYGLYSVLSFVTPTWKLRNVRTGRIQKLPSKLYLPFWKSRILRTILSHDYFAQPLLCHSFENQYFLDQRPQVLTADTVTVTLE